MKLSEGDVKWKDLVFGDISTDLMSVEGDPVSYLPCPLITYTH